MQIIGDPTDVVDLGQSVDKPNTYVQALQSVIRDQKIFAPDENIGDKRWLFVYFSLCKGWIRCHLLIKLFTG